MRTLSKQQVFDMVSMHLKIQRRKSRTLDKRQCMYRSPDGLKCAVGCLIPDDLYSDELEFLTPKDPSVAEVLRKSGVPDDAMGMLGSLQLIHDTFSPDLWRIALRNLAITHGLEWSDF